MSALVEREPILAGAEGPKGTTAEPAPTARPSAWRRGGAALAFAALLALGLALARGTAGPGAPGARPSSADDLADVIEVAEVHEVEHPSLADTHNLNCSGFPYLKLVDKVSSNLGGKGPDTDALPGLIYRGKVLGGAEDGKELELHFNVSSDPAEYHPRSPKENGFQGQYGSINIKANSNVTIEVERFDPESRQHVPLNNFYFTFFDLDQGPNGSASESVTVSHMRKAWLAKKSEIKHTRLEDGSIKFEATTEGSGEDNPKNPLDLTRQQFQRAVTVFVENVTKLTVTFAVGHSKEERPRWFNFRGQPTLLCAHKRDGSTVDLQSLRGDSGAGGLRAGARALLLAAPLLGLAQLSQPLP
mmetsp:Transcript_47655/g.152067  ORF Transcript_47655/g.152067 Transcript_47655/m.152067 type:complete len:359 (-) Transcript_47655:171-1247(-)